MINYVAYRKFVTLKNGKRMMFRFLNEQDRDELDPALQGGPGGGPPVSQAGRARTKNWSTPGWIHLNYQKVLPLLAVDLEDNHIIADGTLHRGKHAAKHIGEIRIFVVPALPQPGFGLRDARGDSLPCLKKKICTWLKAEIIADHKKVIKAFRAKGFEVRATLDDYFIRKDGVTHDVVLMMRPVLKRDEAEF